MTRMGRELEREMDGWSSRRRGRNERRETEARDRGRKERKLAG